MSTQIKEAQIIYASTNCPVVEGLQPRDKKIKLIAKSLETLEPPGFLIKIVLWKRPDGLYETVYGDDVLVAYFDVLGHEEIDAQYVSSYNYRGAANLRYGKAILWWDNPKFGTLEKGRWVYYTLKMEMDAAGLDIEKDWNDKDIRKEYVNKWTTALNGMASPRSINKCIEYWLKVPKEDRVLIMDSAADLRKQ